MEKEFMSRKQVVFETLTKHASGEIVTFNQLCQLFGVAEMNDQTQQVQVLYYILGFMVVPGDDLWDCGNDEQLNQDVRQYLTGIGQHPVDAYDVYYESRDQLVYDSPENEDGVMFERPLTYGNLVTLFEKQAQLEMLHQMQLNHKTATKLADDFEAELPF